MDTKESLREITNEALRSAKAELVGAYGRIGRTDLDSDQHMHFINYEEMSALYPAITEIGIALSNRASGHEHAERISDMDGVYQYLSMRAEQVRNDRDDRIRDALSEGMTVREVCELTSLSRERVYQIRDDRR